MARGCGSRSSWAPVGWRRSRRPRRRQQQQQQQQQQQRQRQRQRHQRVRASDGAAAARGYGASRGSASCSNARARHIHVPLAPYPRATASFGASGSWLRFFSPLPVGRSSRRSPDKRSTSGNRLRQGWVSGSSVPPDAACGLVRAARSPRRPVDRRHDPNATGARALDALEGRLNPADGAWRGGSAGVRGRPGCRSGWWRGWRGPAAIAARAGRRRG